MRSTTGSYGTGGRPQRRCATLAGPFALEDAGLGDALLEPIGGGADDLQRVGAAVFAFPSLRPCRVTRRPSLRSQSRYGPGGPGFTSIFRSCARTRASSK